MKILMIFLDMLRPSILNMEYDEDILSKKLKAMGGAIYTNCYTPAPDTPRSLAAMWSGLYPSKNGCNTRLKYPKFFLKNEYSNLLSVLDKNGYKFNFYMNLPCYNVGILPPDFENIGNHSLGKSLDTFFKTDLIEDEKTFTFVCIEDFHAAIDDYGANETGVLKGLELLNKDLSIIEQSVNYDDYDIVVLFSDHGFRFSEDLDKAGTAMRGTFIKDRAQVFLQIKYKNDLDIKYDNRLCSIMDIAPTILDAVGLKNIMSDADGISLLTGEEHDFLMAEDHRDFSAELGQTIENWAVIDHIGYSSINCNGEWESSYDLTLEKKKKYEQDFSKNMSFYIDNRKIMDVHKLYRMTIAPQSYYDTGDKRNGILSERKTYAADIKNKKGYELLNLWLEKKQKGHKLSQYLQNCHYNHIAIYGWAQIGKRLYDEVYESSIEVKYVIDRSRRDKYAEIEIYYPWEDYPVADAVIVTVPWEFESIKEAICEKRKMVVINIEDLIEAM